MTVNVLEKYCKGCGYCIEACPKNVLKIGTKINEQGYKYVEVVNGDDCIGCKMCTIVCPDSAIEIFK